MATTFVLDKSALQYLFENVFTEEDKLKIRQSALQEMAGRYIKPLIESELRAKMASIAADEAKKFFKNDFWADTFKLNPGIAKKIKTEVERQVDKLLGENINVPVMKKYIDERVKKAKSELELKVNGEVGLQLNMGIAHYIEKATTRGIQELMSKEVKSDG